MTSYAGAEATHDTLLIATSFFGYAKEIVARLEQRGRKVLWFDDRPATDTITKGLLRLAPSLVAQKADAYFNNIIGQVRGQPIRDVLVIKGEALSPRAIRRLREALPTACFTLYFWDSYLNMPKDSPAKVDLFDRAFTFDPLDAARDPRLTYRPLFFLEQYAQLPNVERDIDILFFGTAHSDRYAIIKRLERSLDPTLNFEKILYLPSRLVYWVRRLGDPSFWEARRNEFVFQPVGKSELAAITARARIIVDIERPIQSGYTMRTIEMLGAGKKLVTTNPLTKKADFYRPENVLVIDRERPVVPETFLRSEFQPLPESLRCRYTLENWLQEVMPGQGRGACEHVGQATTQFGATINASTAACNEIKYDEAQV